MSGSITAPETILMLAPLGRDAEVACATLTRAGLACRASRDLRDLDAEQLDELGAIVLTEELLTPHEVEALGHRLDAQPPWANLPVLLLVDRERRRTADDRAESVEAFSARPGVIVLQRPMHTASFISVLRSALLTRQKQYELRDTLDARERAEAHARTLADEMKHRVKNAFAVAGSIASQTFRRAESLNEARQAFSARLTSMSRAQDLLDSNGSHSVDLRRLIDQALEPYRAGKDTGPFDVEGPTVGITARAATAFTMVLHELATNAAKYGALSVPSGHVAIEWQLEDGTPASNLLIVWRESGGPKVAPPARRGFGSLLIENALASDLDGSAQMDFDAHGLSCRIRMALADAD